MMEDCCPEEIMIGTPDEEMTARVKARVMAQIAPQRKAIRLRRTVRLTLLIAAILALMTATAYAAGLFKMHIDPAPGDEVITGTWTERDAEGRIEYRQTWTYPDAGFVLTFESEASPHRVLFKPGWLPSEPTFGIWDAEGWGGYISDNGDPAGHELPYVIEAIYMLQGKTLVLNGECQIVREDTFRDYKRVEIDCVYEPFGQQHYILLMDEQEGYAIMIGGTNSMEDLEHIAQELEVQITDEPVEFDADYNIGMINIGRG